MSDLSEFLLARISEDEAAAHDAEGERWESRPGDFGDDPCDIIDNTGVNVVSVDWNGHLSTPTAQHIARHDPARVLAECKAKRQVIDLLGGYTDRDVEYWALHEALELLALPYVDHPDYRSEWRP